MALPRSLIDPKLIYLEPAVRAYPRGRKVMACFPDADTTQHTSDRKDTPPAPQETKTGRFLMRARTSGRRYTGDVFYGLPIF
jgi:hypothetical protein